MNREMSSTAFSTQEYRQYYTPRLNIRRVGNGRFILATECAGLASCTRHLQLSIFEYVGDDIVISAYALSIFEHVPHTQSYSMIWQSQYSEERKNHVRLLMRNSDFI